MRKVPELDGLRALAVLAVIAWHYAYFQWVRGGYLGVDLFFVLSGFLITSLLVAEERAGSVSLRAFYMRRALRILPPLAACIALAALLGITTAKGVLASAFFAANMVDHRTLGGLMHTWSLAVEEHFYVAWPFLFLALGRGRARFLAFAILAVLLLRIGLVSMRMEVYTPTYARADSLAIGCLAALLHAEGKLRLPGWAGPASLTAVVACMLVFPFRSAAMESVGFTLFALAAGVLVVSSTAGGEGLVARTLRSAPMAWIGQRSYGLYLYHMPVLIASEPHRVEGDAASFWLVTGLRVVATFVLAELSWRTIEAWARGHGQRFRPARVGTLQPGAVPQA